MSKLSFRARALDAAKPMPVFMAEELPDLPDYSAINRAVPQMPSGMQKEEECEHHLQRAICAGLIIPTPEVTEITTKDIYDKIYPANYKQPRQLIHMQPFTMEQDIPDYDADSEDERWLEDRLPAIATGKFEEMMDRLEKSSGQTVVTLDEARALLKDDDDLIVTVFDYWLNKRLKTQHPLILTVKTDQRLGQAPNNPYLAFRRRTEKMQTRKNRKNDEASYEKMLKLRRDLCRAVTLLELVKRREKIKREYVHLTVEVFEKRYQARDFSGAVVAEASAAKAAAAAQQQQRPAFTPIFHNHYTNQGWQLSKGALKDEVIPRREKRQYKKRKHRSSRAGGVLDAGGPSSDEDALGPGQAASPEPDEAEDEGPYAFRRNKLCSYHMPLPMEGDWPWAAPATSAPGHPSADKRFRFALTSVSQPSRRCIGFARRRVGRGGRVILDRACHDYDDLWRTLDFSVTEPLAAERKPAVTEAKTEPPAVKAEAEWGAGEVWTEGGGERTTGVKTECADEGGRWGGGGGGDRGVPGETDEMVEFLRSIRRDWLHFRPKTPPPDHRPPCHMLPADEWPLADPATGRALPFQMELRLEDEPTGLLLGADSEPFLTDPFYDVAVAETTLSTAMADEEVPVTDTRQQVWSGGGGGKSDGSGSPSSDDGLVGVSRFTLTDLEAATTRRRPGPVVSAPSNCEPPIAGASTSTSHKAANCSGGRPTAAEPTNGLLTQFGLDVPANNKTKNNKLPAYVYTTNAAGAGYQNTLSLHTSAHTLTLNSHSANILEIPLDHRNNHDGPAAEGGQPGLANSHGSSNDGSPAASPAGPKSKAIVRKNNLIMEVT